MHVRIKDCDKQFHPDFNPGVVAVKEVELVGRENAQVLLAKSVMEHSDEFLNEIMIVDVEPIN